MPTKPRTVVSIPHLVARQKPVSGKVSAGKTPIIIRERLEANSSLLANSESCQSPLTDSTVSGSSLQQPELRVKSTSPPSTSSASSINNQQHDLSPTQSTSSSSPSSSNISSSFVLPSSTEPYSVNSYTNSERFSSHIKITSFNQIKQQQQSQQGDNSAQINVISIQSPKESIPPSSSSVFTAVQISEKHDTQSAENPEQVAPFYLAAEVKNIEASPTVQERIEQFQQISRQQKLRPQINKIEVTNNSSRIDSPRVVRILNQTNNNSTNKQTEPVQHSYLPQKKVGDSPPALYSSKIPVVYKPAVSDSSPTSEIKKNHFMSSLDSILFNNNNHLQTPNSNPSKSTSETTTIPIGNSDQVDEVVVAREPDLSRRPFKSALKKEPLAETPRNQRYVPNRPVVYTDDTDNESDEDDNSSSLSSSYQTYAGSQLAHKNKNLQARVQRIDSLSRYFKVLKYSAMKCIQFYLQMSWPNFQQLLFILNKIYIYIDTFHAVYSCK